MEVIELERCFDGHGTDQMVIHTLLHYVVQDKNDNTGHLRPASKHIAYLMTQNIQKDMKTDAEKLME